MIISNLLVFRPSDQLVFTNLALLLSFKLSILTLDTFKASRDISVPIPEDLGRCINRLIKITPEPVAKSSI